MPKIPETITLKQTGWMIEGFVEVSLWGGQTAEIDMKSTFIPLGQLTYWKFMKSINDNGFGCEHINYAYVTVYPVFGANYKAYEFARNYEFEINNNRKKLVCRGI